MENKSFYVKPEIEETDFVTEPAMINSANLNGFDDLFDNGNQGM